MTKDGLLDKYKSSYYIESYKSLEKIGEILQKLKDNNVYDQTKIVVLSDHGGPHYHHESQKKHFLNSEFNKSFMSEFRGVNPLKAHALLLVKDFNSQGDLQVSDKLMSNADLAGIVCSILENKCNIYDIYWTKKEAVRTLKINTKKHIFEVKDKIFDQNNYKRIK